MKLSNRANLFVLFSVLAATSSAYASSGQYFSKFTFTNPSDLSTFLNPIQDPQTLTALQPKQQLILSDANIWTNVDFDGKTGPLIKGVQNGSTSNTSFKYLLSAAYAARLNDSFVFGLNIGHPFYLNYNLPYSSIGRYALMSNQLDTLDISPSLAYKINPMFSVAAGFDEERLSVYQKNVVPKIATKTADTIFSNKASDWGQGWHTGILVHPAKGTYLGLTYYSQIGFNIAGTSTAAGTGTGLGGITRSRHATARITLPPTTRLNIFQALDQNWGVLGGIDYTQWNKLQSVTIMNSALGNVTSDYGYKNIFRYSLGLRYALPAWTVTTGVSYDQSPGNSNYQSIGSEGDSYIAGLEIGHAFNRYVGLAAAYNHVFYDKVKVNYLSNTGVLTQGNNELANDKFELKLTFNVF